jgi:hypothetical protein
MARGPAVASFFSQTKQDVVVFDLKVARAQRVNLEHARIAVGRRPSAPAPRKIREKKRGFIDVAMLADLLRR